MVRVYWREGQISGRASTRTVEHAIAMRVRNLLAALWKNSLGLT